MIVQLKRPELKRLEKYLSDEKKEHPGVWRAIIEGLKSNRKTLNYEVTKHEAGLLQKVLAIKNPISTRTKNLREAGAIKETEWIGGNEFYHHRPKMTQFERAEKYGGQLRFELNPGAKPDFIRPAGNLYALKFSPKEKESIQIATARAKNGLDSVLWDKASVTGNTLLLTPQEYKRALKILSAEKKKILKMKTAIEANPAKLERCVKKVSKKSKGVNAWAVCKAALGRKKKKAKKK